MHGSFNLGQQAGRIVLLAAFTLLCLAIVRQSSRLRAASTRDVLTGLKNRAFCTERLEEERARVQRRGGSLVVALLDLDHFKHINDRHGHPTGDAALRAVAGFLSRAVRAEDLVARWGGEEFAILFPNASLTDAVMRVDAVRAALAEAPVR
ncbi:MAG: GGDEF domain-containing protein, partial [Gemmatimonadaceae bacterium]|nr:GGDEF domain-containing protein [Gemmatimonadaceae bacterium]